MANFVAFEEKSTRALTSLCDKWEKHRAIQERILSSTIVGGSLIAEEVCERVVKNRSSAFITKDEGSKSLSSIIYLQIVLPTERCRQKHGGFHVTIDLLSWGHPLTNGSNVRVRQSSTPPETP